MPIVRWGKLNIFIPFRNLGLYYETFVLREYGALNIRDGDLVLDAGASVGDFTIVAAGSTPHGMVVALEPDPVYYSILVENIQRNHLNNCLPLNVALASHIGDIVLRFGSPDDGPRKMTVPSVRLTRLLSNLGLSHFDVVKLDIEGMERVVFKDDTWLHRVREVALETHGKRTHEDVVRSLAKNGFKVSMFRRRDALANFLRFAITHPLDLIRIERYSKAMAFRRFLAYLRKPNKPLQVVAETESDIHIVYARKLS